MRRYNHSSQSFRNEFREMALGLGKPAYEGAGVETDVERVQFVRFAMRW
jgi:hypothetical protein